MVSSETQQNLMLLYTSVSYNALYKCLQSSVLNVEREVRLTADLLYHQGFNKQ